MGLSRKIHRSPGSRRPMLTPEAVVEAAARVLARDGYAGLTMRAIADDLGVQAPALYWYFGDKRALELALFEHLMEGFSVSVSGDDWRDQLRRGAQQLRAYLGGLRDIVRLDPQGFWVGPNSLSQLDAVLGILTSAGLSPHDAANAVSMLNSFVFQWAGAEADFSAERAEFLTSAARVPPDPARYPNVAAAREFLLRWDPDGNFAFRLDAMIAGLMARIRSDRV
ncbi:MAG: TetR/AcrR family transcriptional regulator C-terminal domain-containing protein [Caulobacterales bacterium]